MFKLSRAGSDQYHDGKSPGNPLKSALSSITEKRQTKNSFKETNSEQLSLDGCKVISKCQLNIVLLYQVVGTTYFYYSLGTEGYFTLM